MERLLADSDENVISFDLIGLFNEKNCKMEEIDADEIPDNVLSELFDKEGNITLENAIQTEPNSKSADKEDSQQSTGQNVKSYRFKPIDKEEVDEIASKSCKKKTHKQTTWGVRIFKGTSTIFQK